MSVLNQKYLIVHWNGDEGYTTDIAKLVEQRKNDFRRYYGVAFNKERRDKFYQRTIGKDYPSWDERANKFHVYDQKAPISWWECSREFVVDCYAIIYDGFGRVVHPDVIYQAYLAERGTPKTKFDEGLWRGDKKYFRGAKRGAYGDRYASHVHRSIKQRCEAEQKIDDAPMMRKNSAYYALNDACCWWDPLYRIVQKSWKTQSKARKQWAKNLK